MLNRPIPPNNFELLRWLIYNKEAFTIFAGSPSRFTTFAHTTVSFKIICIPCWSASLTQLSKILELCITGLATKTYIGMLNCNNRNGWYGAWKECKCRYIKYRYYIRSVSSCSKGSTDVKMGNNDTFVCAMLCCSGAYNLDKAAFRP